MFKKNSILDRKMRPSRTYRPNIQSDDVQHAQETAYWDYKRSLNDETHERMRRAFDPEDDERVEEHRRTYEAMQAQLEVKRQQRVAEEEERRQVPEWDGGYREYSAIPWHDRVNPWAGNDQYEAAMRKKYLQHVMLENQELEAQGKYLRQKQKEFDIYETHTNAQDTGVAGKFFNKDQDRDKWTRGMKLGRAAMTPAFSVKDGNPGILEWNGPSEHERPRTAPRPEGAPDEYQTTYGTGAGMEHESYAPPPARTEEGLERFPWQTQG